jgi:hypothetical protein
VNLNKPISFAGRQNEGKITLVYNDFEPWDSIEIPFVSCYDSAFSFGDGYRRYHYVPIETFCPLFSFARYSIAPYSKLYLRAYWNACFFADLHFLDEASSILRQTWRFLAFAIALTGECIVGGLHLTL